MLNYSQDRDEVLVSALGKGRGKKWNFKIEGKKKIRRKRTDKMMYSRKVLVMGSRQRKKEVKKKIWGIIRL